MTRVEVISDGGQAKYFLFKSYSDHLYLHSFPTRRSSDLDLSGFSSARRSFPCLTAQRRAEEARRSPQVDCARRLSRLADRKSTRLNSSHPSISYAVFCLKKKMTHKEQAHARLA